MSLKEGKVTTYTIKPEDFFLQQNTIETLTVSNAQDSLSLIKEVFDGKPGPARDIVVLNAGAAIYAADITVSLAEGIAMAAELIDSGAATQKLNALIVTSRT